MTATDGRTAFDLIAAALRKLRGYWIVFTFAFGAFLWAIDTWQAHAPLPVVVQAQGARLDRLTGRVAAVETATPPAAVAAAVPPPGAWLLIATDRRCAGGRFCRAPRQPQP